MHHQEQTSVKFESKYKLFFEIIHLCRFKGKLCLQNVFDEGRLCVFDEGRLYGDHMTANPARHHGYSFHENLFKVWLCSF